MTVQGKRIFLLTIMCLCLAALFTGCMTTVPAISFESNGGSKVFELQISDSAVKIRDNTVKFIDIGDRTPTKTGYDFAGWFTDENLTEAFDDTVIPTESITLYAKWNPKPVKVTFVSEDVKVAEVNVPYGTPLTASSMPAVPEKAGYSGSWNLTKINVSSITTPVTVKALYVERIYSYKFETNGGSNIDDVVAYYNSFYTKPETPTRNGYIFAGWYTDNTFLYLYEFPTLMPSGDYTLYARWIRDTDLISYFDYEKVGDAIRITGLVGDGRFQSILYIPETIESLPVKYLGYDRPLSDVVTENGVNAEAFKECNVFASDSLTNVIIPSKVELVGSFAFADCKALRRVQFADGSVVAHIGSGAFSGCVGVSTFTVPRTVNAIDDYAFGYSVNYVPETDGNGVPVPKPLSLLYEVQFVGESALVRLGDGIFDGTSSIAEITLPASLSSFNWKTFSGSSIRSVSIEEDSLHYMSVEGVVYTKIRREGGMRPGALIYYPANGAETYEVLDGVTSIAENAFNGNRKIKEVTLPPTVTFVGGSAFYNSSLSKITFKSGSLLQDVMTYAFSKTELTEILLPSNLQHLREGAFAENEKLSSVTFAVGVSGAEALNTIENKAFYKCAALTEITVPSSVESIGNDAFNGCLLLRILTFNTTSGDLNSSLKTIGDRAFYECTTLARLDLPKSLITIGDYAFAGESRMVINSVSYIGQRCNVKKVGAYAFKNCVNLTSVNIPSSIEELGEGAYYSCGGINNLTFETNITMLRNIPSYCFYGCSSISRVKIPASVTEIQEKAFMLCVRLEILEMSAGTRLDTIGKSAFESCIRLSCTSETQSTQTVLPSGVKTVRERAFYGCTNLSYVILPRDLTTLESYVFGGCTKLAGVGVAAGSTLSYLSDNLFYGCIALETFKIPSAVQEFRGDPFNECSNLASFSINDGDQTYSVSNGILFNKSRTELILYPKASAGSYSVTAGVSKIAPYAFHNTKISTLDFESAANNVFVSIGEYAFADCSYLVQVTIRPRVTGIGDFAFNNCSALTSVEIVSVSSGTDAGNLVIGSNAFKKCYFSSITVRSRVSAVGDYAFAENLNLKNVVFEGGDTELSLGDGAFYKCKSIDAVVLPARINNLGNDAFAWCTSLASVVFAEDENSRLTIGDRSFSNCHKLLSLELPGTLVAMGEGSFSYDSHLRSVVFKEIFNSILNDPAYESFGAGEQAFLGCGQLQKVTFSSTVNSIGAYAFYNCDALTSLIFEDGADITVGEYAFAEMDGMEIFEVSSRITELKDYALYRNGMKKIVFEPRDEELVLGSSVFSESALYTVELPVRIYRLGEFSFKGCISLKKVTFDEGSALEEIKEGAFEGVFTANIPDGEGEYEGVNGESIAYADCNVISFPSSLRTIGKGAFANDEYLKRVVFNDGLETIEELAFYRCIGISETVIPSSVLYLGDRSFYGCTNLTSVGLTEASSMETIGSDVFTNCLALSSLYIGEQVAVIGDAPAANCKSLVSLEVHTLNPYFHSVGNVLYTKNDSLLIQYSAGKVGSNYTVSAQTNIIGKGAFIGNTYLTSLNIESQNLKLNGEDVFKDTSAYLQFFVNSSYLSNYKQAFVWKNFDDSIVSIDTQYENYVIELIPGDETGSCRIVKYTGGDSSPSNLTIPANINGLKVKEIGEYAFQGSSSLVNLTLPQGVHTIGRYAFANCVNLKTVVTGVSLKTIGNYAFSNCRRLSSVSFGQNSYLNAVPDYCFFNCSALSEFTVPARTTSIGAFAFAGSGAESGMSFSKLSFEGVSGLSAIGNNAFQYCVALSDVKLPSSVKLLGKNLFLNCTALLSMTLERQSAEGVTMLADGSVFNGVKDEFSIFVPALARKNYLMTEYWKELSFSIIASNLTFDKYAVEIIENNDVRLIKYLGDDSIINVPSEIAGYNVVSIGENCFGYNLLSVYLPDSVVSIEQNAFKYSVNLNSVSLSENLVSIGAGAFRDLKDLTILTFRGGVESKIKSIGDFAFYNCGGLNEFNFYEGVTYIGQSAFAGDANTPMGLRRITFYGSNIAVADEEDALVIASYAFRNCRELLTVDLPNNLSSLGDGAFADCVSLVSVYLRRADNTSNIVVLDGDGPNLFLNDSFVRVYVTSAKYGYYTARQNNSWFKNHSNKICSIANIMEGSFSVKITGTAASPAVTVVQYLGTQTDVSIPSIIDGKPVTALDSRIIGNRVTKVTLPPSLTAIGESSFYGATALSEVVFDGDFTATEIKKQAFYGCTSLKNINLPFSVSVIGPGAFQNSGIVDFTVNSAPSYPSGFSISIEENAFNNCDSLVSITLTNMVQSIGNYAFANCDKLTDINFNLDTDSLLTTISQYAFSNCSSLVEVVIPSSVTSIGNAAFGSCAKLEKVFARKGYDGNTNTGEPPRAGTSLFANVNNPFFKIYVPSGSYNNYKSATNWLAYADNIVTEQETGDFEFLIMDASQNVKLTAYNGSDENLEIPARVTVGGTSYLVTAIGRYFGGQSVKTLTLPSSIATVDPYAFAAMSSLEKVVLPAELTEVGNYAFANCVSLTQITLSEQFTRISEGMFSGCSALREIVLPETVAIVNKFAFDGCTSLVRLIINGSNSADASPIVGSVNMLTNTAEELCIFVANSSLAAKYNVATNWNTDELSGKYYAIDSIYGDYAVTYVTETVSGVTSILGMKVVQIISEYDELTLVDSLGGYDIIELGDDSTINKIKKLIVYGDGENFTVGKVNCEVEFINP